MAISLKDPVTDRLARELTSITGESLTKAIEVALRERLARENSKREAEERLQRLRLLSDRCAEAMGGTGNSLDHDELFYDERLGLPR